MGVMHKKKPTVILEKGTVEDDNGKKYNLDFVGDDNDFVNISYADEKKKVDESIKNLFKQNTNEIHDICFINDYSLLLVGCNNGLIYVYKRKINGKSNLKFEEITHFKPHNDSIIQILRLQSGHILTLSSDSSCKILEIEIETNDVLYQNENRCDEIQKLLDEGETSNNNFAIELESGNLVISQGMFINFYAKIENEMPLGESLKSTNTLNPKEYYLTKKICSNSDNIFFVQIDIKTLAASQVSNKTLQFYNVDDYNIIANIPNIEFNKMNYSMCLINKDTLAIGGNNGSIYLVDVKRKILISVSHFENCDSISCIKSVNNKTVILGCQYWNTNYDVILYEINNEHEFNEIKRTQKVHNNIINDIKLITMDISKNKNPFTEKYNVITLGLDYKVNLILNKDE